MILKTFPYVKKMMFAFDYLLLDYLSINKSFYLISEKDWRLYLFIEV